MQLRSAAQVPGACAARLRRGVSDRGAPELGVLYEAGDHRFDGGGIWFAKIEVAGPRPQTKPHQQLADTLVWSADV